VRIVFFCNRFWPAVGGVERYVAELARALLYRGHQVAVVAGDHTGRLPETERHDGIFIHRFPATRSPMRCRLRLIGQRRLFNNADIVHICDTQMVEYYRRMIGWIARPRTLCMTMHGMSCIHPVPDRELRNSRRAARFVDAVAHDGNFIGRWLGIAPNATIPQGLRPKAGQLANIPEPDDPSAAYIGRLEPDTGVYLYFDALAILRDQHNIDLPLHVYGAGSLDAELKQRAANDNLDVTFHGTVNHAQFRLSDHLLAFVSGRMAIHEAMARRRAVVAAWCNPIRADYVREEAFSPFILTGGSGEELASHAARLITEEPFRHDLIERALDHVRPLSWERTADAYLELWQNAAQARTWWQRIPLLWRFRAPRPELLASSNISKQVGLASHPTR
jgi:glycosyltransferase involved in cell wall biosynthesis